MDKKIIYLVAGVGALIIIIGGIKALQFAKMMSGGQGFSMPPTAVTTANVKKAWWEATVTTVGSLSAVNGLDVPAVVPGKVIQVTFKPGSHVDTGDLLLVQDTSSEEAQLRAAQAATDLAKINLQRNRELLKKNMVPQAEFDASNARYKEAIAQADNIRTLIDKKKIRAPFSGRLGTRLISPGQNLKEGEKIVSLQSLNPILVNFQIPQMHISKIIPKLPVRITTDTYPGEVFEGKITAVSPAVNPETRNIQAQATISNQNEKLLPGMFVNITGVLPVKNDVLTIPSTSVLYAPYGNSVFVVEESEKDDSGKSNLTLKQQFVRLGESHGDFVSVISGLNEDEVVVSSGVFKLRNGQSVFINNELSPEFSANPNPADS